MSECVRIYSGDEYFNTIFAKDVLFYEDNPISFWVLHTDGEIMILPEYAIDKSGGVIHITPTKIKVK